MLIKILKREMHEKTLTLFDNDLHTRVNDTNYVRVEI